MSMLTSTQAQDTFDVMEATWPREEIDFVLRLPAREAAVFIEAASLGMKPLAPELDYDA